MSTLIDFRDPESIPFEINDPEVHQLAEEMRARYYHKTKRQFRHIELPVEANHETD